MSLTWIKTKHDIQIKTSLDTYAYLSGKRVEKVVIALHGFGDNAKNACQIALAFSLENILFLFLEAPLKVPMTHDGYHWFDLFHNPYQNIQKSFDHVQNLFTHLTEDHQISSEKIYFFGFSQGAALATYCGLKTQKKIGGIISISGFLIHTAELFENRDNLNKECPVLLIHGDEDQTIFPVLFYEAEKTLKALGLNHVHSKLYKVGHTINHDQIKDITKFIES